MECGLRAHSAPHGISPTPHLPTLHPPHHQVEIKGACCGAPNIDVHVSGAPTPFSPALACGVPGQHGPFRPPQGAPCCPQQHYTLSCVENPEAFVEAANRAKAHRTGHAK